MFRRSLIAPALVLLALAGCGGPAPGPYPSQPAQSIFRPAPRPAANQAQVPAAPGMAPTEAPMPIATPAEEAPLSTAAPSGRRVALLAPMSGANAERGQALAAAARLALSAPGSPALEVLDTGSTPDGAAAAANQAIGAGAGMIIGPLTAAETAAVAPVASAAGVPVLAFTNDAAQARRGVWTLGLTPAQQLRRLTATLTAQGKTRFAAVLPQDAFGGAMGTALTAVASEAGLAPPTLRTHEGSIQSANATMRSISDYGSRRGPIEAQIKAARALGTPEGRRHAQALARQPIPPPPMDALVLADSGDGLHLIASLLPFYDLDPPAVRILGPAQWGAPGVLADGELTGAWFAAPDPALRADFSARYAATNGAPPPGLADLAYDAASIARVLAGEGYSLAALCRPEGFSGVNGLLALQSDGGVRRGLAVFEIRRGGPALIEPAPTAAGTPGT